MDLGLEQVCVLQQLARSCVHHDHCVCVHRACSRHAYWGVESSAAHSTTRKKHTLIVNSHARCTNVCIDSCIVPTFGTHNEAAVLAIQILQGQGKISYAP